MIDGLKPYPKMTDTGVEWLGEVPAHWSTERLKSSVTNVIAQGTKRQENDIYVALEHVESWTGRLNGVRFDAEPDSQLKRFAPGDVLFGKLRPYLAKVACPTIGGLCVGEFLVLRPRTTMFKVDFLERLLRSKPIIDIVDASTFGAKMPRAEWTFVGSMDVVRPPLLEQIAISCFLDHADRRIGRYIDSKEKLIALLQEQKRAIVHEAVTGGIDVRTGRPYPAYKPSGVEWLGHVPVHWELRRLKWVTRLQRGYDLPADNRLPGSVPVVSSGGVIDTHVESKCVGPGVVMGRYGSTDAVFFIEQDFWPHNTSLFVTDFQGNLKKWCFRLLQTITKADHAEKSAVPGVDRKDLFQIVVPLPPIEEQQQVSRHVDSVTQTMEALISREQRQIDLLHEYRTRLIADVVTGKLDVREAAAALPQEPDDSDAARGDCTGPEGGNEGLTGHGRPTGFPAAQEEMIA